MKCKASLASRSSTSAGFFVYVFGMRSIRGRAFTENVRASRMVVLHVNHKTCFVTLSSIYIKCSVAHGYMFASLISPPMES